MNVVQSDILLFLKNNEFNNQREMAGKLNYSLGLINKELRVLEKNGFIDKEKKITNKAELIIKNKSPKRAIILAAGICTRMVPINTSIPKALLNVNGDIIIEKQINYLNSVGISEIYVVVGYMKEKFEYLIDKFNIKLIVNPLYNVRNNYYSLYLLKEKLNNCYIIPSDIVMYSNPFSNFELYSWYMLANEHDINSNVKINRNREILKSRNNCIKMIGIAYITSDTAKIIKNNLDKLFSNVVLDAFWEKSLESGNKYIVKAKISKSSDYYEINSYEDLRNIDSKCIELEHQAINIICESLNVLPSDIVNIKSLKKGMTNKSFSFQINDCKYIMRIPGAGTDKLISRKNEYNVYSVLKDKNITDDIIYINSVNGFKLTKYIDNARTCDSNNLNDLKLCIDFLRKFHNMNLKVEHEFDLFNNIDFYESLWNGKQSDYADYITTKKNVLSLREYVSKNIDGKCLCHMDSVADNFLIYKDKNGKDMVRLIDFEYAGMQDPHVDIAMFCIYSLYNRNEIDRLIDIYFLNECPLNIRIKIYCYIAICGLLWSNWCEYKKMMGIEFGEYSLMQYRYAKEYYKIAIKEMEKINE